MKTFKQFLLESKQLKEAADKETTIYLDRFYNIIAIQKSNTYTIQFENGDYKVSGNNFEDVIKKFYKSCDKYEGDLLDDLLGGNGWENNNLSKSAKKVLTKMIG